MVSLFPVKFSFLDNFLFFDFQKVSRFGKPESIAKVQKITELCVQFHKKYMQKIVNTPQILYLQAKAISLFHFTHHKSAFDGRQVLYLSQFIKDKLLILFHITRANL